jgi:hypothetical protein
MFVRVKRTARGTLKHYLVQTFREGGKVRQRTVAYLGRFPTVGDALRELPAKIAMEERILSRERARWGNRRRKKRNPGWKSFTERMFEGRVSRMRALLERLSGIGSAV